jgi:hypothetical protein
MQRGHSTSQYLRCACGPARTLAHRTPSPRGREEGRGEGAVRTRQVILCYELGADFAELYREFGYGH